MLTSKKKKKTQSRVDPFTRIICMCRPCVHQRVGGHDLAVPSFLAASSTGCTSASRRSRSSVTRRPHTTRAGQRGRGSRLHVTESTIPTTSASIGWPRVGPVTRAAEPDHSVAAPCRLRRRPACRRRRQPPSCGFRRAPPRRRRELHVFPVSRSFRDETGWPSTRHRIMSADPHRRGRRRRTGWTGCRAALAHARRRRARGPRRARPARRRGCRSPQPLLFVVRHHEQANGSSGSIPVPRGSPPGAREQHQLLTSRRPSLSRASGVSTHRSPARAEYAGTPRLQYAVVSRRPQRRRPLRLRGVAPVARPGRVELASSTRSTIRTLISRRRHRPTTARRAGPAKRRGDVMPRRDPRPIRRAGTPSLRAEPAQRAAVHDRHARRHLAREALHVRRGASE